MANPKRRHSKARTGLRRSTWRLRTPGLAPCPQCHEPRLPHRACPHCGHYRGRHVLAEKEGED